MSKKKRWKKLWLQVIDEAAKYGADYLDGMMVGLAPSGLKHAFHDGKGKVSKKIKKLDRELSKLWKISHKRIRKEEKNDIPE